MLAESGLPVDPVIVIDEEGRAEGVPCGDPQRVTCSNLLGEARRKFRASPHFLTISVALANHEWIGPNACAFGYEFDRSSLASAAVEAISLKSVPAAPTVFGLAKPCFGGDHFDVPCSEKFDDPLPHLGVQVDLEFRTLHRYARPVFQED